MPDVLQDAIQQQGKTSISPEKPTGVKVTGRTRIERGVDLKMLDVFKTAFEISKMEILEDDDVVQSLIVKGALSALVGSSGIGKSTMAFQIAYSIVQKQETVFGLKITTTSNDVIYWSTEDSLSQWKKRINALIDAGADDDVIKRLHFICGTESEAMDALAYRIARQPFALIIIDVYSDVYTDDSNNMIQVRSFLKKFKNLAMKHQTSFLFIHHIGKRTEKNAPSKNNIMGSQGFESAMRSVFELRSDQHDPTIKHLCILKHNYLSEAEKKQSIVLKQHSDLSFVATGERRDLSFLSETSQRVAAKETLVQEIIRLRKTGMSTRSIEQTLREQGMEIGKSRIAEIIKEHNLSSDDNSVQN